MHRPGGAPFPAAGNAEEQHQACMSEDTLQAPITLREWWKPAVLGFDCALAHGRARLNEILSLLCPLSFSFNSIFVECTIAKRVWRVSSRIFVTLSTEARDF
jgi:hypothetical protein